MTMIGEGIPKLEDGEEQSTEEELLADGQQDDCVNEGRKVLSEGLLLANPEKCIPYN